ncbi:MULTISPECIES: putative porin [unclassified Pseudomonas]|uniref:putative porin n=1 Tax=unclassified Pseudomonas TaxID=196821 RepID=UPI0008772996|nr:MULTISPECIES: putative porin [unclassified Pseudomonas]SCZ23407.1 Putative porin [Pseudomonas sp. NFACC44-2]SDA53537.1 Putative porin [Pseudomonas sp. NFACC51]SDY08301.1 Putative porin [Pseudomonas sp. NFACC08-1]SFH26676.1 Putative porin [Pseudomonas sp. NFACC54]SFT30719.1 Putative porin [Pseudomonas sp. NFACC48-1]
MISNVNRLSWAVGLIVLGLSGHSLAAPAPSENATINLIRLLVQQGVLKQDQADGLIAQAEREAVQARQATTAVAAAPAGAPGDVRVQYVPNIVREQIRDQVKAEVMATAKQENWAQPNTFPDWVSRISFDGDIRLRDESRYYSGTNSNEIVDFARLNDKGPYDVNPNSSSSLPPLLNTREDRENLFRLRARLGMKAVIAPQWTAGIRIGTGSDNNPVSTTQTLGGGFGKKDIWLDQGYLTWKPSDELTLTGGRFANPFFSTDLLYSGDLNFDGVAANFNHKLNQDWGVFGTVGAFPVEYTNDTSTSNGSDKEESDNKWLYGAQLGANWAINDSNRIKGALAYYRFDDIEGQRSSPCQPWAGDPGCDSDGSRVAFMQKGNTVFLLRDITPNPLNPSTTPQPQYVGLASEFNLLDLNLALDTDLPEDLKLRSQAHYVHNLGYDEGEMRKRSEGQFANNLDSNGEVESGANAWMLQFTLGNSLELKREGDWNLFAGYKYIQPDALPDGFNDSSFHLGGTNAKGYFLGGNYGLASNVFATGRWLSSEAVYGAPYDIDVLQLEINTRF